MKENNYEIVKFEDGNFKLNVRVSPDEDTVWLTQSDMATLLNVDVPAINKHISNIINENELNYQLFPFWKEFKKKEIDKCYVN